MKQNISQLNWTDLTKHPEKISIEFLWRVYSGGIFEGKEISAVQYSQTKEAFYVGFSECFKLMSDFATGLEESQACDLFSAMAKESGTFLTSLIERRFK